MTDDMRGLLDEYEARGDETVFERARPLYEEAIVEAPGAEVVRDYAYLLECHGRYALRAAVAQYERAIELDPDAEKSRYQLISARTALGEAGREVARYRDVHAASPADVQVHRLLAAAHLAAGQFEEAGRVIEAGLELSGADRRLVESRGDVGAAVGNVEGALADWRRALNLDPEDISAQYSIAFLLEREGRLEEAVATWLMIKEWAQARGYALDTEWPTREIGRIRSGQGSQ